MCAKAQRGETKMKNEERFTGKAESYSSFRPSYPKELIDYLYTKVGVCKESIVADIGSGTGIFSRLLLERGNSVYCVEPNDDMRRMAENDLGGVNGFKNFISIKAPAERTGLQENSVDFVTVAQAFHWFDKEAFQKECHRILKQNGQVVLIWNIRDSESEFMQKDYQIRERYCMDRKGLGIADESKESKEFFLNKICEERTFRNDLMVNRETYIGMNLSRSYSPSKDKNPDRYHAFVKKLNELFDQYNIDGVAHFPQFTKSYVGKPAF